MHETVCLKVQNIEPKLRYNIGEGSEPKGSVTRRVSAIRRSKVAVFVVDKRKKSLMPCSEKRARKLLGSGRARVHRLIPFSIRIVDREVAGCVDTTVAWVKRFQRVVPVIGITQELVRFDMQLMQNAEISGVEYQQGTLAGYEVREYLLSKWNRECSYCGVKDVPLQIEHIHSKACGGSNRVSNLALACQPCNQKKGAQDIRVFLAKDTKRLDRILAQAKRPLKDAAAVNTTRWALFNALKAAGVPVTTGSGGLTKYNRVQLGIPKTHALDAVCVGAVSAVTGWQKPTLAIKATGRGSYQRTRLDAFGFPRGYLTREKRVQGFQTGDMVSADVPKGKKIGFYVGRVAVRATGSFNIQTAQGVVQGISHRCCKVIQRADGYGFSTVATRKEMCDSGSHKAGNASRSALYLPGLKAEVSRAK